MKETKRRDWQGYKVEWETESKRYCDARAATPSGGGFRGDSRSHKSKE